MKRKVQAQRKFAQGAYIPPSTSERRTDVTPVKDADAQKNNKNVVYSNMSAAHLLDMISLKSIHHHGDPIVLVERLPKKKVNVVPTILPAPLNKGHNAAIKTVKNKTPSPITPHPAKLVRKRIRGAMQLRSRSSLKQRRFTKKELVINSKAKFTRTRVMKRRLISKLVTVSKKKTLVNVPKRSISPIMSEFSTDDDTPLNQITQKNTEEKKKSPEPVKSASPSPTTSQVKRKRSKPLDDNAKKLCTLRSAAAAASTTSDPTITKPSTEPNINKQSNEPKIINKQSNGPNITKQNDDQGTSPVIVSSTQPEVIKSDDVVETALLSPLSNTLPGVNGNYYGRNEIERWIVNSHSVPPEVANSGETQSVANSEKPQPSNEKQFKIPQTWTRRTLKSKDAKKMGPDTPPSDVPCPKVTLCPSLKYNTLKSIQNASKSGTIIEKCHGPCQHCSKVSKLSKLVTRVLNVLHEPAEAASDVYAFNEPDATREPPLLGFRQNRRRSRDAASEKNLYLDLLPQNSSHIVQLVSVKVNNQDKTIMRARLVPKAEVTQSVDEKNDEQIVTLMEQDNFLEELLTSLNKNDDKPPENKGQSEPIIAKKVVGTDIKPQPVSSNNLTTIDDNSEVKVAALKNPKISQSPPLLPLRPKLKQPLLKLHHKMQHQKPLQQPQNTKLEPNAQLNDKMSQLPDQKTPYQQQSQSLPKQQLSQPKSQPSQQKLQPPTEKNQPSQQKLQVQLHKLQPQQLKSKIDQIQHKLNSPQDKCQSSQGKPQTKQQKLQPQQLKSQPKIEQPQQKVQQEWQTSQPPQQKSQPQVLVQPLPLPQQSTVKQATPLKDKPIPSPSSIGEGGIVDAPVFYPTETEFENPFSYLEKITPEASKYGICKIVSPPGFSTECQLREGARFTACNQYPGKMFRRWGSATRELCAIKKHLATQKVLFTRPPLVDSVEVNLPKLYHIVQRMGGLKKVIEKEKWQKVAEEMNYPKGSQVEKKLDQVYVKYLLPYDTLTNDERQAILENVGREWDKRYKRMLRRAQNPLHKQRQLLGESSSDDDEEDEDMELALEEADDCIVTGRSMNLATFEKVARNVMQMQLGSSADSADEIERRYWRLVEAGDEHVCVNAAAVDTADQAPPQKPKPSARHPWNLKMLSTCTESALRSLGPVLSVTVPTLHFGMLYSSSCWHRDPHGLPWTEFLHQGPDKIWYGIPDSQSDQFRRAVEVLCPAFCQNKSIWLPSDVTMIPPDLLVKEKLTLTRATQRAGDFIIVFPKAYSCSICTGYTISESVYYAPFSWLETVANDFEEARRSHEPTMFSVEQLLLGAVEERGAPHPARRAAATALAAILRRELEARQTLAEIPSQDSKHPPKRRWTAWNVRELDECDVCRCTLYLSKVTGVVDKKGVFCLEHALRVLSKFKGQDVSQAALVCFYPNDTLHTILAKLDKRFSS